MQEQRIKEILIERDSEFKMLFVKHQELEEQLQRSLLKRQKSDEERVAEKNLKKEKLRLKDAMQKRIDAFRRQPG
ncbi:MAG TPA: YdcH family protein [Candidatus Aminicenantes bacterium]|nr:YdcH family protein [Candidatus Aminicenantes bacterium]